LQHAFLSVWLAFSLLATSTQPVDAMRAGTASPAQQRMNIEAFARLFGYVRFFHPSSESAGCNWNQIAINGVQAVKDAVNDRDLAQKLQLFFSPIAPAVRVYLAADPPESPAIFTTPSAKLGIVMWRHYGVYIDENYYAGPYKSERIHGAMSGTEAPTGFPDPRNPYKAQLAGDVRADVPLALYEIMTGSQLVTWPRPVSDAWKLIDSPKAKVDSALVQHWADVVVIWTVLQHFYPYFDVARVNWDAALTQAIQETQQARSNAEFHEILRRLLVPLQDGHARVSRDTFTNAAPVELGFVEDQIVVLSVQDDVAAGIRAGDVLLSVNGRNALDMLAERERLISSATPQWRRWSALKELLAQPVLEPVKLGLESASGGVRDVLLQIKAGNEQLSSNPVSMELEPGIWYVDLRRLLKFELDRIMPELASAKGIVFEMRGYPTQDSLEVLHHLIDQPVRSAQWLVPITTKPDRHDVSFLRLDSWKLEPKQPRFKGKIAFLVDGRAISYAESYLNIVEYYKLAEIVGEPTAGTNGNVNVFKSPGGYTVIWTGMKVLRQDGSRFAGIGIQPTIPASFTLEGVRAGRDEQLERALLAVKGDS
jgi:hypothetical protein